MARARRRLEATDKIRYPNFEGIGPDITGFPQAGVEPGARRGNIGTGGFAFPNVTRGQTRLEGLQGPQGRTASAAARGATPAFSSGGASPSSGTRRTPVQGRGALQVGGGGNASTRRSSRSTRG